VTVFNLVGDDFKVIHAELTQRDYANLINWIGNLIVAWQPDPILIEAMGAGLGLKHWLEKDSITNVADIVSHNGKSKIELMEMVFLMIESGRLWLPEKATWREAFIKSLMDFPNGKNKDWPDSVSQLLLHHQTVKRLAKYRTDQLTPTPPPPGPMRRGMHYQRCDYC